MRTIAAASRVGKALLSLFFPPHCANCGASTPDGVHLCEECAEGVERIGVPRCECCSQPFFGALTEAFVCSVCSERQLHFSCAVAACRSRGVVREFLHRFKYGGQRFLRLPLGGWLCEALDDDRLQSPPLDGIVPVPLHPTRFRERGFNQAELLAALLSARSGLPMLDCLERIRYTTTQTRLNRGDRMENLRNAFRLRQTPAVSDRHLLLVDDVFTTGSTVDECARVLRLGGAASVRVATVARG